MSDDFFDPPPDEQVVVLVESATLHQAERLIESCEHCDEEDAQIPFDNILDCVTGSDPSVTDYILEESRRSVQSLFIPVSSGAFVLTLYPLYTIPTMLAAATETGLSNL